MSDPLEQQTPKGTVLAIRERIVEAYPLATTDEERSELLTALGEVCNIMERGVSDPHDLEELHSLRRTDYRLLIVQEATSVEGDVSPAALARITAREVAAGRMAEDDEVRTLALAGASVLGPRPPPTGGLFRRWFGKKS